MLFFALLRQALELNPNIYGGVSNPDLMKRMREWSVPSTHFIRARAFALAHARAHAQTHARIVAFHAAFPSPPSPSHLDSHPPRKFPRTMLWLFFTGSSETVPCPRHERA